MIDEFSRLQRQRVSERELADAQAYLAGSFPLTIETPNEIASQVINNVIYELPVEEISTYRERVLAVTPDDIQRVSRSYIMPERLSVVLVGNAKAFVSQLKSVGFAEFEVIPIEQLDLMSATLRRDAVRVSNESVGPLLPGTSAAGRRAAYVDEQLNPGAGGAPRPSTPQAPRTPNAPGVSTPATEKSAADLLRGVITAKGGLLALKGVRTVIAEAQTVLQLQKGTLPSSTKTYIVYPDRFRVDAEVNGAQTSQVYNAGKAWVKSPAGVQDAPPPMLSEFAAGVRRDMIPLLIDAAEGRLTVRALPEQKGRDGRPMRVLEISGTAIDRVRLYVDNEMLIAGQAYSRPDPTGRPILTEEVFSDYRDVNGVRVPFEAQLLQNGQPILKRTLTNVVMNGPVADTVFAKPM
jgi:hypothetical protein